MTSRSARILAVSVLVAATLSMVASIVFQLFFTDGVPSGQVFVHGDLDTPGMRDVVEELRQRAAEGEELNNSVGGEWNPGFGVVLVALLVWIGVGAFIVWRQPRNWAGWLFIITGAPFPTLTLFQGLAVYGMKVEPDPIPALSLIAILAEFSLYPLALIPLLFLLYPDGHLPSPRWRWSVVALVGGTGIALLGFLLRPGPFNAFRDDGVAFENPLGIDAFGGAGAVIGFGTLLMLLGVISTPVAVVLRFRRSRGDERQRMRLIAIVAGIAGTLIGAMVVLTLAVGATGGIEDEGEDPAFFPIMFGLVALTIVLGTPASYVVAILRHRLWDIDVVVRKAVIFAVVAGAITLGGVLFALVIPALVFGIPLVGTDLVLVVAGVALGLLIGPIRRRARRVADRIVFGGRATPYEVLTAFSERVAETYATDDVLPRMARVLGEATGAASARVALRVQSDLRQAATWPEDAEAHDDGLVVDVVHQGEDVGTLAVTMPPNDPMDASKERLVRDLAAQAGPVLRNVRLIEELRASRQRLVVAQDEERRKLERNLHDGAQQQLVALQVQLRLAEQVMDRDAEKAREIVHRLQGAAASALEDLRELARGIYPPLLADQGLGAALEAQARKASLPVTVETDGTGRYPREVESAIYFCSLEALNNIAKYAHATAAVIRLAERDDELEFRILDDGAGFDRNEVGHGTGLRGMADRLEAIGGTVTVTSAPGSGTTVVGRIPLQRGD